MQNIKNILFLDLTPRQKSQLLGTLKAYFKKFCTLSKTEIIDKFFEDEKYYIKIENPHFEFMKDFFEDEKFYKDVEKYLDFLLYEKQQKELMQPYIDKQKELLKEQKKRAQEYKMSKQKPTKKQLFYYDKITKAHNIQKKDTTNATKLDLRNWIMEILDEFDI
jgi:hypothetical protein